MKPYLLRLTMIVPIIVLVFSSCSDDDSMMDATEDICDTNRYSAEVFTDLDSMTVQFASANPNTGHTNDLFMDVYMPADDTLSERPLVIWAFGGAFISGDRSQMHALARTSARHGFVAASIDYRILASFFPLPDSTELMDIAVKASSDMKAAIRHFYLDADTDNQFRVDTDKIYVGGISAGAITALLTAVVDESDLSTGFLQEIVENNGGIHGNTGSDVNQSYAYDIDGVINLSGAVYSLDFLDTDDPPIFSVHGDMDDVVPYEDGYATVFGFELLKLYGSKAMFDYAQEIGLHNDLVTIEGGLHVDFYSEEQYAVQRAEFYQLGYSFLKNEVCQ